MSEVGGQVWAWKLHNLHTEWVSEKKQNISVSHYTSSKPLTSLLRVSAKILL